MKKRQELTLTIRYYAQQQIYKIYIPTVGNY